MPVGCVARTALTKREHEVLTFTVAGWSSKRIAVRLGISARTVAFHRANLWRKLRQGGGLHCPHCGGTLTAGAAGV
ncbi:MAG: LuxR C-terminal-related transcriptional regulator [Candidatus Acidiferrales bacterium]